MTYSSDFRRKVLFVRKKEELTIAEVTADIFTAWVKQDSLPQLPKNAVIVMDNATFHKRQDTQNMIRKAGHSEVVLHCWTGLRQS